MIDVPGYDVDATLHEGERSLVHRARRASDGRRVILKILNQAYPDPLALAQLKREHDMTRVVAGPGVIEALGIERCGQSAAIVLEDFGATSLARLLEAGPFDPAEAIRVGVAAASALARVHALHVIHKDVNPSNLVYAREAGVLKLIDFGISTDLVREESQAASVHVIEGTLAYISPEQTGRMNRATDHRTDLYSLGATLYHLVTGRRPFVSDDPLELIHAHLARAPTPPHAIRKEAPRPLSAVILKLLAKTPEERYQSARGVEADLARCLEALTRGEGAPFPLGEHDEADRFLVPDKLYGREQETAALLAAFDRAGRGGVELLLVPGKAGVGKSSIVHELQRPILERRGAFTSGKFEQFQRDVPYAGFVQALQRLVRQILTEPDAVIAAWKGRLEALLGPNGKVVTDVIPEVELILGPQPDVPDLPAVEAQHRHHLVFQRFIAAFASADHPLVLVLDDLQWADAPSLRLIELLATAGEASHLFLVGAYRDNEVDGAHPLAITLRALDEVGARVTTVSIGPLAIDHVTALAADALHVPAAEALPLARLCLEKTEGNPFFLGQFLKVLHEDGLLVFDAARGAFGFDLAAVAAAEITDNVVELMAAKIRRLPEAAQRALRTAAFLGNAFKLSALSAALERSRTEAAADLHPALSAGVVVPLSASYKFVSDAEGYDVPYRFAHDRVQQAAHSLVAEEDRAALHLAIGRLLLDGAEGEERAARLFEIVDHLRAGRAKITERDERDAFAELALEAGRRAAASAAFDTAYRYLSAGLEALGDDGWDRRYDLCLALSTAAASAVHFTGDVEAMERLVDEVIARGRALLDKIPAYEVRVEAYLNQGRQRDGLTVALSALDLLGVHLPMPPSKLRTVLGLVRTKIRLLGRSPEAIVEGPLMTDPRRLASMRIMAAAGSACYALVPDLMPVLVFEQVGLSVAHGNAPESAFSFAGHALVLCGVLGDIPGGRRFADLALRLTDRPELRKSRGRVLFLLSCFAYHWYGSIRDTLQPSLDAYRAALDAGDLEYAFFAALLYVGHGMMCGAPLAELDHEALAFGRMMKRYGDPSSVTRLDLDHQFIHNLAGHAPDPLRLSGDACDGEAVAAAAREKGDLYSVGLFHVCELILGCLFHDYAQAQRHAEGAMALLEQMLGTIDVPATLAYSALAALGAAGDGPPAARRRAIRAAGRARRKMAGWARHAPQNYDHWVEILAAEIARLRGDRAEAITRYDRAIDLAREHGFVNHEALACELAGRFHLGNGRARLAEAYLLDARHAYLTWGAHAKVKDIEARYAGVLPARPEGKRAAGARDATSTVTVTTSSTDAGALDLGSVMKASQAISSEIVLDTLLRKLMAVLLETAGAQRGHLLVEGPPRLAVSLDHAAPDACAVAALDDEGYDGIAAPRTLLRYVHRTRETVALDDAAVEGAFTRDPYVVERRTRSALCLPVLGQQKLIAVLYLENDLSTRAFAPARCKVLEILSAQAAISLENARLYETLDSRVKDRTRELTEALAELQQTQRRLVTQEKLASLGMLTSGIAHEIKNPLNFINNFAELTVDLTADLAAELDRTGDDLDVGCVREIASDLRQNAAKIREHGKRADGIVEGMLKHSRGRAGEPREVDLNALVREYTSLATSGPSGHAPPGLAVESSLDAAVGVVQLVPEDIGRVLVNLLGNALYATTAKQREAGEGWSPRVAVSTRALGERVEIRVGDNGTGIPAAIRDKVCMPFFTTKPAGEGTGLGLSLSYDIVVQGHGGTLDLESEEGAYTEFRITLPRRATPAAARAL